MFKFSPLKLHYL